MHENMADTARHDFLNALERDEALWQDFNALCDHGGRLAGTSSEHTALEWCAQRLQALAPNAVLHREQTPYAGWTCDKAELIDADSGQALEVAPLLGTAFTPPEGLMLEVLDLDRGTPEQIKGAGDRVKGRAVMVRHEYPFAKDTVHRRVKLAAAQAAGAAAFLVVQPEAGVGAVSGSSGRAGGFGIPAMGISIESADRLRHEGARVRMWILGQDLPDASTQTLVLEIPGQVSEAIVLSAHIDGHPLAESALDNATGVAAALAIARQTAALPQALRRTLKVCIFSAEEWALHGSRVWLARRTPEDVAQMMLNVNLDSLAGSPRLHALTSGFEKLTPFVASASVAAGVDIGQHLPPMPNSDHANFAAAGVPALRLIAGFDEPESELRLLLTRCDTRSRVDEAVLRRAVTTAGAVTWCALQSTESYR